MKPIQHEEEKKDDAWLKVVDTDVQRLKEEAKQTYEKIKKEKKVDQQIRLICNQITPDNFDKKFDELRSFIFRDMKTFNEDGYVSRSLEEITELTDSNNIKVVVESIFKKAQNEK